MEDATDDSAKAGRASTLLITSATSLIAIAAVAGVYLAVRPAPPEPDPQDAAGAELIDGSDYRLLVAVARVRPRDADGGPWDSGSDSNAAPDPYYEIWWRGNLVYESQEVENVLVASWSNVALPEFYKLIADEKVSLETMKEGALITARRTEEILIRVYDQDPFKDDLIEELTVPLDELRVGDSDRAGRQGLESLTLRVIPRDTQQLMNLLR